jgi:hypothetical protein
MKKDIQPLLLASVLFVGAVTFTSSSLHAECDSRSTAAGGDSEIAHATCGLKSQPGTTTSSSKSQSATMQVFIDPRTGEITQPPAAERSAAGMQETVGVINTPAEGLEETSSPVSGGGVVIDLQGRFNRPTTTTQGGDENAAPR